MDTDKKSLTITLPEEDFRKLQAEAKRRNLSIGEYATQMLDRSDISELHSTCIATFNGLNGRLLETRQDLAKAVRMAIQTLAYDADGALETWIETKIDAPQGTRVARHYPRGK